jgi:ATP-dependent Lhr-like helicase
MPLWLQRLKAADLLQAVRDFPSFPIVVETYRDVLQDAFDLDGMRDVLSRISSGALGIRQVQTELPSPFARSLQLGFVMDWMYDDDTPRAEARAALLSLDRALLDELMGGQGADETTLGMLEEILARRRGTATGWQARDADELAVLVDRVGDVTRDELLARVAPAAEWRRGDPVESLLTSGRLVGVDLLPGDRRFILVDAWARYSAAFGNALQSLFTGVAGNSRPAAEVIPEALQVVALTEAAARREVLGRYLALSGPVSVADIATRYAFDADWVKRRLEEWERTRVLVRGSFGPDRDVVRWTARRSLERARRVELARARKQIKAVSLPAFARFMQRWQHLTPDTRLTGSEATASVMAQLYGLSRPAAAWERDYLPARMEPYEPGSLSALAASGQLVWAADPAKPHAASGGVAVAGAVAPAVGRVRFFERGTGRLWVAPLAEDALGEAARAVLDALRRLGASFTSDLAASTSLGPQRLRDALRELVAAGLVTNDTIDALRDVLGHRPVFPTRRPDEPDPTRWLPEDFTPSKNRYVVQRRPNVRKLARWKRPDRPGVAAWGGRWSLVHTPGSLGFESADGPELAEPVARQWLARYGVVSRDWWRRERPAVSWREIYHELKRLEFRGEVQRGYFVAGLAGAQFALPDAVEMLRAPEQTDVPENAVVMAASDPANVYSIPLEGVERDSLSRPRGSGALLVTVNGRAILSVEGRGRRISTRVDEDPGTIGPAVSALVAHLTSPRGSGRAHDIIIETIDGEPATSSPLLGSLLEAGFRREARSLRYYAAIR